MHLLQLRTMIFLGCLSSGCATTRDDTFGASRLTLETAAALHQACSDSLSGDAADNALTHRTELCLCLANQGSSRIDPRAMERLCGDRGDLDLWSDFIYAKMQHRWPPVVAGQDPQEHLACMRELTHQVLDSFWTDLFSLCQEEKTPHLEPLLSFPPRVPLGRCWEITGIDDEGCLKAEPCPGKRGNLQALPISPKDDELVSGQVSLCHEEIQAKHKAWSVQGSKPLHNDPFALELSGNRAASNTNDPAPPHPPHSFAGLNELPPTSSGSALQPGCILINGSRQVTVVLQSDNFCFFYEGPTGSQPPQLRTRPCHSLWQAFPGRWCPTQPMVFTLKDPHHIRAEHKATN